MKIGCPTEIKPQEFRVGMTPNAAQEAVAHGHDVLIQSGAGIGSGFSDEDYIAAGAVMATSAQEVFEKADRAEEHTSELQSRSDPVCRLLLEKKNCWSRNRSSDSRDNGKNYSK